MKHALVLARHFSVPLFAIAVCLPVFAADLTPPTPGTKREMVPIDLTAFYGTHFKDLESDAENAWRFAPQGAQVFEGVPFHLHGIMEVTGLRAAREKRFHPTRIEKIPVGRRGVRLHLLHGAGETLNDDTPLANLILRFANGREQKQSIIYGRHVRNWFKSLQEQDAVIDANSRMVWVGASPASGRYGMTLRLYLTSIPLVAPDQELSSIDIVSLFSDSVSVICGRPSRSVTEQAGSPNELPRLRRASIR
jgi:hypothetical protein